VPHSASRLFDYSSGALVIYPTAAPAPRARLRDFEAHPASALCADNPMGQPPIPLGQLALATLLQACPGVSDSEVIEARAMDRRW